LIVTLTAFVSIDIALAIRVGAMSCNGPVMITGKLVDCPLLIITDRVCPIRSVLIGGAKARVIMEPWELTELTEPIGAVPLPDTTSVALLAEETEAKFDPKTVSKVTFANNGVDIVCTNGAASLILEEIWTTGEDHVNPLLI